MLVSKTSVGWCTAAGIGGAEVPQVTETTFKQMSCGKLAFSLSLGNTQVPLQPDSRGMLQVWYECAGGRCDTDCCGFLWRTQQIIGQDGG